MRNRIGGAICGIIGLFCLDGMVNGAEPVTIYVSNLDTNIVGENRSVAQDFSDAIETAFTRRRQVFRLLERRKYNDVIAHNKLEKDLRALARGEKPSVRLVEQLRGADAVIAGEMKETRLDGVVVTISLTRMDSEKLWQAQRKHSLYDWLNGDIRQKEAESLAADAEAALLPKAFPVPESEDGSTGIARAQSGDCTEALPLLRNAAAVDVSNTQLYLEIGRCENRAGEFPEASQALTSAIARSPRRSDLFVERAQSFAGQKLYSRALEDLDAAIRLSPGNLSATELRGDVFSKTGKYSDAVDCYYTVYQQSATRSVCIKLVAAYRKNGTEGAAKTLELACPSLP